MKGFIDCHCHISAGDFDNDIEDVIENSKKAGLLALLAVAEHVGEFEKIIQLSQRFPGFIFPCLGVHPIQGTAPEQQRGALLQDLDAALPLIEKYKDHLVAIGEVGLDFTPRFVSGDADKDSQRQVLIRQAEIAKQLDLPLNVHSRSAGRPTIHLLKEQGVEKALLHAFDGKPSVAMEGVKAGYFFSIPPSIVRSEQQKLVKQLPLESMCLETDSPALGPEKQRYHDEILRPSVVPFISRHHLMFLHDNAQPHLARICTQFLEAEKEMSRCMRQMVRNEPKNISVCAEYISKIKGVPLETVMEVTTQNALRLFPRLKTLLRA